MTATLVTEVRPTSVTTFGVRHPIRPGTVLTQFSIDVVDGNGLDVCGEPVTARFDFGGGAERVVTKVTDRDSRAWFAEEHDTAPRCVTLTAGRETTGTIRPAPGTLLIIET